MVAALAAAHRGLSTVVIEKAPHFGGSTARSGGGLWIPNNEVLQRDGVEDTAEAARTYLHGIVGDIVEPERIDAYLDRGPEMLSFVLKHTPLKMCWVPRYADYYPEAPGGRAGGRSIEPKPFDARKLGEDEAGLEPAYGKVPLNVVVMQQDYVRLNQLKRHPRGVLRSLKVGARTMWAKATGKNLVGMGRALIGPLRIGLQRAGVPVRLNTALTDLFVEDGVVRGVYVSDTTASESAEPQLHPGPTRGDPGQRRFRAERTDAGEIPARADHHRVDRRRQGQYRRRHHRRRETGCRTGSDGGRVVGTDGAAGWCAVVRIVGAQFAGVDHRQHVGQAIHERIDAIRRSLSPHVRRGIRPGARAGREHSGVAGVRPAVPGPLHLRGTQSWTTYSAQVAGVRRDHPGRHARGAG